MTSEGTLRTPPVHLGKLREFLTDGNPQMQDWAMGAVFNLTYSYGVASLPVWNELLELAVEHPCWNTRESCQGLVGRYLKNEVGAQELLYKIRGEAMKEQFEGVDGFFISCGLIAMQNGHNDEAAEIFASVIHKDEDPPKLRDAIHLQLRAMLGTGKKLEETWGKVRRQLLKKEAKEEISHLENLRGMMKPQEGFGREAGPKREPASAARGRPKKLARC
ncbi:hypothetical protein GF412_03095 [Candidatus Micrarchaeota archaeon]|nr:hypothetical protein [Candidatus Micrarchaeota archaeon]MBD3417939.1 hypothetical protein [Candidatus Micrarchaeota archaeon]